MHSALQQVCVCVRLMRTTGGDNEAPPEESSTWGEPVEKHTQKSSKILITQKTFSHSNLRGSSHTKGWLSSVRRFCKCTITAVKDKPRNQNETKLDLCPAGRKKKRKKEKSGTVGKLCQFHQKQQSVKRRWEPSAEPSCDALVLTRREGEALKCRCRGPFDCHLCEAL